MPKMKPTKKTKEVIISTEMDDIIFSDTPSKIKDESYWVYNRSISRKEHPKKYNQSRTGKWLIFVDIKELDKTWKIVRKSTESGDLGIGAKAATAKPNPNATSQNEKVICVYTYNWLDVEDVFRIEKELRNIGITSTLFYKTDADTIEGNYKISGAKGISKYISKKVENYNKVSLDSLHNVGYRKLEILQNIGISTIEQLLDYDTSQKLKGVGINSDSILKLKILALSQLEKKIYRTASFEMPKGSIIQYDIETDLELSIKTKKVWSIAVLCNNEYKNFYAENWDEEKKILNEFIKYIRKIKNPILLSYSGVGFDKNVLYYALKRHELESEYFSNMPHYDLCSILKKNFIFPIKGYGLKDVGKYLGYGFSSEYFDGLYVAMQYIRCQKTGDKLPKEIFNYIKDDVYSMEYIIKELKKKRTDIKDLDYTTIEKHK